MLPTFPLKRLVSVLLAVLAAQPVLSSAATYEFKRTATMLSVHATTPSVTPSGTTNGGATSNPSTPTAAPAITLSTTSLDFGGITVAGTSAAKSVAVINSGTVDTSIGTLNVSGQFAATTGCGATLAAGATCYANVTFKPTTAGTQNGQLTLATGAGTQTVSLLGQGQTASGQLAAASGSSTDFGTVAAGSTATRAFVFTNTGTANLTGVYADTVGSGLSVGSSGNTCGTQAAPVSLASNASCQFNVVFSPTGAGAISGAQARVTSTAANSPSTLALTGSGQASTTTYTVGFNGTQGSTTFNDSTSLSSWSSVGGAALTTSTFSEGTSSVSLNGNGQAVAGPVIDLVNDFTIQISVRPTAYPGGTSALVGQWRQQVGLGGWLLFMGSNGTVSFELGAISDYTSQMTSATALPLNQWTKVTVTRQGSAFRMYINGVQTATYTSATVGRTTGVPTALGSYYTSGPLGAGYWFTGQLDDLQIRKDIAVAP